MAALRSDETVPVSGTCTLCQKKFNQVRRRFRCGVCRAAFCSNCCQRTPTIPGYSDKTRVCKQCKKIDEKEKGQSDSFPFVTSLTSRVSLPHLKGNTPQPISWNPQLLLLMNQVKVSSTQLWLNRDNLAKLIVEGQFITSSVRDALKISNLSNIEQKATSSVASTIPGLLPSVQAIARGHVDALESLRKSVSELDHQILNFFSLAGFPPVSQSNFSAENLQPSELSESIDWGDPQYAPVLWDFHAQNDDELSVHAGQVVVILKSDPIWTLVQNQINRETGYVPTNYLERTPSPMTFVCPIPSKDEKKIDLELAARQGFQAYQSWNYLEAARLYHLVADLGLASAQNNLGWLYENGEGVKRSNTEAVRWYRKAADQGDPGAQSNLGRMYESGRGVVQSNTEALRWYRMAADQGDPDALFFICENDYNLLIPPTSLSQKPPPKIKRGIGRVQNSQSSLPTLPSTSPLSLSPPNPHTQFNLGAKSQKGKGVEQSDAEAVRSYRLAADQGYACAQYNLGLMYESGQEVERSYVEAARWFRLAASQGYTFAQFKLGEKYEYGQGVKQSHTKAVEWYRLATDQGLASAQHSLGWMYENGRGVERQSDIEAVRWYQLAADQGLALAQFSLARMYEKGQGVEQNNQEAIRLYRLAADQGNTTAQFHLYLVGNNCEQPLADIDQSLFCSPSILENQSPRIDETNIIQQQKEEKIAELIKELSEVELEKQKICQELEETQQQRDHLQIDSERVKKQLTDRENQLRQIQKQFENLSYEKELQFQKTQQLLEESENQISELNKKNFQLQEQLSRVTQDLVVAGEVNLENLTQLQSTQILLDRSQNQIVQLVTTNSQRRDELSKMTQERDIALEQLNSINTEEIPRLKEELSKSNQEKTVNLNLLAESDRNLNAILEEIENNSHGMLRAFFQQEPTRTENKNRQRATLVIQKYLLHGKTHKESPPWIAEQWDSQYFTNFEPGCSLLQRLEIEERLGKRTNPKLGSLWYGTNAAVYSARSNSNSNIPSSYKLSIRLIYGYVQGPGATFDLEQRFEEVLSFCNLRHGKFAPHSNVLPVLHHWIQRDVPFHRFPDFDGDLDVIGTHAAISLSPECACNLEQLLSRRTLPLNELEVIHIGRSVASGLAHLFNNKIVHRDLKMDNVLLYWWDRESDLENNQLQYLVHSRVLQSVPVVHDLDEHLSFSDYSDYANEMKIPISPGISRGGAQQAISPEVLAAKPPDRFLSYLKNDAWALGVVLYQMLHYPNHKTSLPYSNEQWYRHSLSELPAIPTLSPESLPGEQYSLTLKQLICDLLRPDPIQRISLAEALNRFDSLLKGVPFNPTPTQDGYGLLPPISSV